MKYARPKITPDNLVHEEYFWECVECSYKTENCLGYEEVHDKSVMHYIYTEHSNGFLTIIKKVSTFRG